MKIKLCLPASTLGKFKARWKEEACECFVPPLPSELWSVIPNLDFCTAFWVACGLPSLPSPITNMQATGSLCIFKSSHLIPFRLSQWLPTHPESKPNTSLTRAYATYITCSASLLCPCPILSSHTAACLFLRLTSLAPTSGLQLHPRSSLFKSAFHDLLTCSRSFLRFYHFLQASPDFLIYTLKIRDIGSNHNIIWHS